MGSDPVTTAVGIGAATGVIPTGRTQSGSSGPAYVPGPAGNKIQEDIRKNTQKVFRDLGGRFGDGTDHDLNMGFNVMRALGGESRPVKGDANDLLSRKLISQDEFEYLQSASTGATDVDKIKEIGKLYRKIGGRSGFEGGLGTGGADTDETLLAIRRGKDVRDAKKDAPGLRAQTLLGTMERIQNPTPGTTEKDEEESI